MERSSRLALGVLFGLKERFADCLLEVKDGIKKIRKKHSVGAVVNRVVTSEQVIKQATHPKLSADSKLQSCDAHGFRSKYSPGVGGVNKFEGPFELPNSNACTVLRNEPESVPLPKDRTTLLEQRVAVKGNNKRNVLEDNSLIGPNTMIKGKVSRLPRTGSINALGSSLIVQLPGSLQGWEQRTSVNKVSAFCAANNQKRLHPRAQWAGRRRPHKNSRTRRSNLVSPVSSHVEAHISSQVFSTSDFNARTSSVGANGSLLASSVHNNTPKFKQELESIPSPVGLADRKEGAGEDVLKEKEADHIKVALSAAHKFGPSELPTRKNKIPTNQIGDGVQRQGRSGRGSSLKSKSGCPPSKKVKDGKVLTPVQPMLTSDPADITGESDDEHEELYANARSANDARNFACYGPMWKKMENLFTYVGLEDISYWKQQGNVHKEIPGSSAERQESHSNEESTKRPNTDVLDGRYDLGRLEKTSPLCYRVLSAMIKEDEIEEFYHHGEGKNMPLQYVRDDSHCGSCNQIEIEPKDRDKMESEAHSCVDYKSQKNGLSDNLSCDKSVVCKLCRNPSASDPEHGIKQLQGDDDFLISDVDLVNEIFQNDLGQVQRYFSSPDFQYQLMSVDDRILLELQSIGLYLPDLADGEVISKDDMEIKEGLNQQGIMMLQKLQSIRFQKKFHWPWLRVLFLNVKSLKIQELVALVGLHRGISSSPRLLAIMMLTMLAHELLVIHTMMLITIKKKPRDQPTGAVCSTFEQYVAHCENLDRGSLDVPRAVPQSSELNDVVGSSPSRAALALDCPVLVTRGKRSTRGRNQNRNQQKRGYNSRAGRSSLKSSKNEHKTKGKQKQKNKQLSTSGNKLHDRITEASVHGYIVR